MELWEKAFKILGKSKGARLMTLGILMMTTGGGSYYALQGLGVSSPLSALILVFGILSFVYGFDIYVNEGKPPSRRRRGSRKSGS